jgi:gamma-glutamyl-gamma-aminobutyrate hydrolase PuuD
LIPDIRSELGGKVNHVGHSHTNELVDTKIREWLGVTELAVNSFHNQGVVPNLLASTLRVFAISKWDGLIEGILHPTCPILGIQWHPERSGSSNELDLRLLQGFLQGVFWYRKEQVK